MSRHLALAVVAAAGGSLWPAPAAFAGDPLWNGQYVVTLSANAKNGTSTAAEQPEYAHRAIYSFSSSCSSGVCVATVNNPPPPKNQYMPQAIEFTWNGSQWVREMSWK